MRDLCIGIHVHAEPHQLRATLEAIRHNTSRDYDLLLLPDGPDEITRTALQQLSDLPQSGTEEPLGAAACFNRLASNSNAAVVILLESGSLPGPNWLEHLFAALELDPQNGLAGPSTNLAWNEQCAFPNRRDEAETIARAAREATDRFGDDVRTLEPLYSLSDFCYAVRREVIDSLGAADETYGLGPCWEMDYNIRAARAGFRGVWACAAYVHRLGFTARRTREEALRFEASRRHYQDKFCGARLRGEKTSYRVHCRGDLCSNFAPRDLIRIHEAPLGASTAEMLTPTAGSRDVSERSTAYSSPVTISEPLVSCIMPTYNRRSFVTQAIRCFLKQDYDNRELVIVDDGGDRIADCVPVDPRIRYIGVDQKLPVGSKRNLACLEARGEFIAHWDDDDWYPATRLRRQMISLLDRGADVCGSSSLLFYNAGADKAFEYKYTAGGRPWVAGSTMAYRRRFWERNRFSEIQVGEDSQFVWGGESGKVSDLSDPALCVAMIHASNTSPKETSGAYWTPISVEGVRDVLGGDLNFYRGMAGGPLVSAIMPTCNRRSFVRLALERFIKQDYPNKELVVVDDGDDAVGDLVSPIAGVRYVRMTGRKSIGAKRNIACEEARGEIIAHWDDDDWYAPDRLRYQAAPLIAGEADITGLENALVLEIPECRFWTTQPRLHQQMFVGDVHGGTLAFHKRMWLEGVRYPEISLAEDAWLLHNALQRGKRLMRLANPGVFVYVRHGRNAWRECMPGRFINPAGWQQIERPAGIPAAVAVSYQLALENQRDGSSTFAQGNPTPEGV